MVLGKLDNYMRKNQTELLSHTIYRNNSKWIKVLNLRPEITKFLRASIGSMLFDSSFSNTFLGVGDLSTQARQTRAKITKWEYVKLKICQQMKRQLTEWEKIFANNISSKKLISKYIQSTHTINIKNS